jgi:hypothetical protein
MDSRSGAELLHGNSHPVSDGRQERSPGARGEGWVRASSFGRRKLPDKTNLEGIEFTYAVSPAVTSEACYAKFHDEEDGKATQVLIHGLTYRQVQREDGGLGHGVMRDLYATYLAGTCYLFEADVHTLAADNTIFLTRKQLQSRLNQAAAVMQTVTISPAAAQPNNPEEESNPWPAAPNMGHRWLRQLRLSSMGRMVAVGVGCFALFALAGGAQANKSFRDPRYGVFFSYPAQWTVDSARRFEPEPLSLAGQTPLVRVGLSASDGGSNPFPHSTFEGAEFVVVVVEGDSAKDCRHRLDTFDLGKPASVEIGGVLYERVAGDREDGHHAVKRTILAAAREHRCFLFEEDIHEARAVADDDVRVLRPEEQAQVQRDLDAAMHSVRYLGGLAR